MVPLHPRHIRGRQPWKVGFVLEFSLFWRMNARNSSILSQLLFLFLIYTMFSRTKLYTCYVFLKIKHIHLLYANLIKDKCVKFFIVLITLIIVLKKKKISAENTTWGFVISLWMQQCNTTRTQNAAREIVAAFSSRTANLHVETDNDFIRRIASRYSVIGLIPGVVSRPTSSTS